MGAAVQAGVLTGDIQEVLLLDVTPLSLGVETAGGVFTKLVDRNTTLPTQAEEVFTTSIDNQPFVEVHVLQGEREMADDNKSLARFQLTGIPPAPRGVPKIKVTFAIDADGMMTVSALDEGTGRAQRVTVIPTSGLTESDIERIVQESVDAADKDLERRALVDARNRAESILYSSERALEEFGGLLPDTERSVFENDVFECKRAIEHGDLDTVEAAILRLEGTAQKLGELIYAQSSGEPLANEGGGAAS